MCMPKGAPSQRRPSGAPVMLNYPQMSTEHAQQDITAKSGAHHNPVMAPPASQIFCAESNPLQEFSSHSGMVEPQGDTLHNSFQQLYPVPGNHNQQIAAQMSFQQSSLLPMDHGYDNGSSLHTTIAQLIAENQQLSNMTDELFVTKKILTEQLRVTKDVVESLKPIIYSLFADFCGINSALSCGKCAELLCTVKPLENREALRKVDGNEIWHPNGMGKIDNDINAQFHNLKLRMLDLSFFNNNTYDKGSITGYRVLQSSLEA
ncbi:uncharacterized protein EDB93DRAFT_1103864 [Suillus bovinus]|uniref:uncharacterized protein n=1 Tax=Suillus bovinus TaxID=48563 RepID=UPI001B86904A|nr:uncharacterized protein EDB93DRAFT_1103864 [Suillus bovinus]KAG2148210.1 hypothetical protein EDB93DRAFT_1103864 [Suillus bovinus]